MTNLNYIGNYLQVHRETNLNFIGNYLQVHRLTNLIFRLNCYSAYTCNE